MLPADAFHGFMGFDLAVAEGVDQILAGDQPAGPAPAGVGEAHTRVFGVVVDVHHAVAVAVVMFTRGAVGVLRVGQLAGVEVDLLAQLGVVPHDARVEDRHDRVSASALCLPRAGRVESSDLRFAGVWADRVDGVVRQFGGEAEQVKALVVEVRGAVGRRLLGVGL